MKACTDTFPTVTTTVAVARTRRWVKVAVVVDVVVVVSSGGSRRILILANLSRDASSLTESDRTK